MFYWSTVTLICSHIVCGSLLPIMAELNNCNRDYMWPAKPKRLTTLYRMFADLTSRAIPLVPRITKVTGAMFLGQAHTPAVVRPLPWAHNLPLSFCPRAISCHASVVTGKLRHSGHLQWKRTALCSPGPTPVNSYFLAHSTATIQSGAHEELWKFSLFLSLFFPSWSNFFKAYLPNRTQVLLA